MLVFSINLLLNLKPHKSTGHFKIQMAFLSSLITLCSAEFLPGSIHFSVFWINTYAPKECNHRKNGGKGGKTHVRGFVFDKASWRFWDDLILNRSPCAPFLQHPAQKESPRVSIFRIIMFSLYLFKIVCHVEKKMSHQKSWYDRRGENLLEISQHSHQDALTQSSKQTLGKRKARASPEGEPATTWEKPVTETEIRVQGKGIQEFLC